MSLVLMRCLLVQYLLLAAVSWWEGRGWQACYWAGATILTLGVLGMR